MFTPNSIVRVLSVPLTMGDRKQISFSNVNEQTNYFLSKSKLYWENVNYQRQDAAIVVSVKGGGVDSLQSCNYVMYQNTNFTKKWFYAFITRKEWVSENAARLYLKTDVFQTWMFNWDMHPSMVIREHTETDNYYEHTLPENLETGEVIEINRTPATTYSMTAVTEAAFDRDFRCVVCSSVLWRSNVRPTELLGGVPRAAYYYGFNRSDLPYAVSKMVEDNGADSIICIYAIPKDALYWDIEVWQDITFFVPRDKTYDERQFDMPPRATPNGMANSDVKNKKCFCYPYHYYTLHDFSGHSVTLAPQNFDNASAGKFKIRTVFNGATNPCAYSIPMNYLNMGIGSHSEANASLDYGICYDSFPELAYATNFFSNYLALNKAKLSVNSAAISMKALSSMSEGVGATLSAVNPIVSAAANLVDMQKIPDRISGDIGGNIQVKSGAVGTYISEWRVKDEYLKVIDQYFTMYGYKVLSMKTPQFRSRKRFNYVQTQELDITGDIPQDDLIEIQALFNGGITVWKYFDGFSFGSYAGDNTPG